MQSEVPAESIPNQNSTVVESRRESSGETDAFTQPEPDEDWASFPPKKGKKVKKGRKSMVSTPPVEPGESQRPFETGDMEPITRDEIQSKQSIGDPSDRATVEQLESAGIPKLPLEANEPPKYEEPGQDYFSAYSTPKKGKKGKKAKRNSETLTPAAETETGLPVGDASFEPTEDQQSERHGVEPLPDSEPNSRVPLGDAQEKETTAFEPVAETGPRIRTDDVWEDTELLPQERADAPQDVDQDGFWAPSLKFDKKGKKGKRATLPSTPPVEEEAALRELEPSQVPSTMPSDTAPDQSLEGEHEVEPEFSATSKKQKKGKKMSKAATFDESEENAQVPTQVSSYGDLVRPPSQSEQEVEQSVEQPQESTAPRNHSGRSWDDLVQEDAPIEVGDSGYGPEDGESSKQQDKVEHPEDRSQHQFSLHGTVQDQAPIEDVQPHHAPQQPLEALRDQAAIESESSSFTDIPIKKTKKGKKKGKMNLSKLAVQNPGASAEELETILRRHNEQEEAAQIAREVPVSEPQASSDATKPTAPEPADVPVEAAPDPAPDPATGDFDIDQYTSSSKKSKKQKRREKETRNASLPLSESNSAKVPSAAVEEQQMSSYFEPKLADFGASRKPIEEPDLSIHGSADRPQAESMPRGDMEQSPNDHGVDDVSNEDQQAAVDTAPRDVERTQSPHDVDFAATVAAGLEDSGFDPNLAVNNPSFHRRTSPPNAGPEADPEEVAPPTNRRRNDGRRSTSPPQAVLTERATPTEPVELQPTQDKSFDDAVSAGLSGAGFDAAITKANSEALPEPEQEDFFPFKTGKKKKGKKGKKSGNATPEDAPEVEAPVNSQEMSEQATLREDEPEQDRSSAPAPEPEKLQQEEAEDYWSYQPKKKGKKTKKRSSVPDQEASYSQIPVQTPEETSDTRYLDSFTDPSSAVPSEIQPRFAEENSPRPDDPSSRYDGHDYNYDLPADLLESTSRRSKDTEEDALAQLTNELERRRKESMAEPIRPETEDPPDHSRVIKEEPSSASTPAEPEDEWTVPLKKGKKAKKGKKLRDEDDGLGDESSGKDGLVAASLAAGAGAVAATVSGTSEQTREQIPEQDEWAKPSGSKKKGKNDKKSKNMSDIALPAPGIEREQPFNRDVYIEQGQQHLPGSWDDDPTTSIEDTRNQERELPNDFDYAQQGNQTGQYATSAPAGIERSFSEKVQEFDEARREAGDDMGRLQTAPVQPERWEDLTPPPEAAMNHRRSEPEPSRRILEESGNSVIVEAGIPRNEGSVPPSENESGKGKKSRTREALQPIRTNTEELFHQRAQEYEAQRGDHDDLPASAIHQDPPPNIWVEPATTDRPQLVPRTTNGSEETGALMMAPPYVEDVAIEQSIKHSDSTEQMDSPIPKKDLKDMAEDEGEFTKVKKTKKKKGRRSGPSTPANEPESAMAKDTSLEEQEVATAPMSRELNVPFEEAPVEQAAAQAEEWAIPAKKSKKGKKGKKDKELAPAIEPADVVETGESVGQPVSRVDETLPETGPTVKAEPETEWAVPSKKDKKGKKGKKPPEPPTPAHAPEDVRDERTLKERHFDREDPEVVSSTQPEETNAHGTDNIGPTTSSRVSGVFPHLQRVKHRTPSMDAAEQNREPRDVSGTDNEAPRRSPTAPAATWGFPNRDSGFGTDSPVVYQEPDAYHDPTRDSGYHDTPTDARYNRLSMGGQTDITEIEDEPSHDYHQSRDVVDSTGGSRQPIQQQHPARQSPIHTGTSTSSGDPLRVSVEVDPDWELSISKQRASAATSANASEVSPIRQSAGIERGMHEPEDSSEYAPPSPVDSTTKQRTSYLFNTPPSVDAKGSTESTPRNKEHFKEAPQERESPTADTKNRKRSRSADGEQDSSGLGVTVGAAVAAGAVAAAGHSIFGHEDSASHDQPSAYDTPASRARSGNHLEPIEEHSPEDSALHKRAMSDTGSPDREAKSARRTETPQQAFREQWMSPTRDAQDRRRREGVGRAGLDTSRERQRSTTPLSTDELIDRLSWPPVDEEQETVGIDRVLSGDHSASRQRGSDNASPRSHASVGSISRMKSPTERIRSPGSFSNVSWHSDTTPPLRRSSRQLSGDLRARSKLEHEKANLRGSAELSSEGSPRSQNIEPPLIGPSDYDRVRHKGKARAGDMSDVYVRTSDRDFRFDELDTNALQLQEGTGRHPGSPMSPTRPPSIRKRQSTHIIELEQRVDQLISENRMLNDAKAKAADSTREYIYRRDVSDHALAETVQEKEMELQKKHAELHAVRELLSSMQAEVARLSEVNEGLTRAKPVGPDLEEQHRTLQEEHANIRQQWQQDREELASLRDQHAHLNVNMEGIMRDEISHGLEDKEVEIRRLREELQLATQQIRALQQQILDTKASSSDWLIVNDEDYFDTACQDLCAHVQSWIKRFSKWSDSKPCRPSSSIPDDKLEARLDNAVLDGSDVDQLLGDRTKRRDVFMSVVMTMIWEYVFTRYLFGMDREQRQKLKALEKLLADVGPSRAVAQWRATTLTLLAQRPQFALQKQQDTHAVAATVFDTLALLLPPPPEREPELRDSLRKVLALAVDLAIQMRCQRAEYIMLPPLQPEYDTNGDLSRKVTFNASLMHDRSGDTPSRSSTTAAAAARVESNEELEARKAVVKIVLFPLVVKKGDDDGEGEDEIVVCPAQVLVAKEKGKRVVRVQSGAMEIDDARSAKSERTRGSGTYSQFEGEGGMI